MAKQNTYPLLTQHTYVANGTTRVELPQSGYITHIDCTVCVNDTVAGSTAVKEDPFHRLVKSMRIKAAGRTYIDFSDGRQWKYFAYPQYRGQLYEDTIPGTATAAADYFCHMPIHLGTNPMDKYDPSVVIPAVRLQDLVMEVTWGSSTDIGASNHTVAASGATYMILQIYEIVLSPGEKEQDIWRGGLLSPRIEPKIYSSMSTYSNLGFVHDLPVGDVLNRVVVLSLDSSDLRTDTNVTSLGFKLPKHRETPLERLWRSQLFHDRVLHDLHVPVKSGYGALAAGSANGVAWFYGSEVSGRPMGLDLTKAVTGDAQIAATVGTASGALQFLHVMYQ